MSFTSEEQPTQGQDPQATPDPTVAAPAAPVAQTPAPPAGPWSADLARAFEDEQQRAAVDSFLRETVQPYTTRLEEKARSSEQAMNLWTNFEQDPINTYVQVTHELMGEEAATAVLERLQQVLDGGQQQQQRTPTPEVQQQMPGLNEEDQAVLNWARQEQAKSFYNDELSRVMSAPENQDLLNAKGADGSNAFDHISPFVHVADGDFDKATVLLRSFVQRWGIPQESTLPAVPDPPAPNVFGSDTTAGQTSATPTEQPKQSLDQAIDEFMREDRERRNAPPMGAV